MPRKLKRVPAAHPRRCVLGNFGTHARKVSVRVQPARVHKGAGGRWWRWRRRRRRRRRGWRCGGGRGRCRGGGGRRRGRAWVLGWGGGGGVPPPMGAEVVGGVLVASAGLPPQATSVPASGMAAIPLSTRRRAVKFVPLFSSWFIALGDWGGQSSVPFGRSIGNSRQTLCQAGRPAKNGRCAGFYAQRSQARTGK